MSTQNYPTRIVILGGGYAGLMAAFRLASKQKALNLSLTLVNGNDHFVERIRLHQVGAGQQLRKRPFAHWLRQTPIQFVQGWVTRINASKNSLNVQTSAGSQTLLYDYLLYAVGSKVDLHVLPGIVEHAHTLTDEQSSKQLFEAVQALPKNGRILTIGAGLTGLEISSELAESYPNHRYMLVTSGHLEADFSPKGAKAVRNSIANLNITLREQTPISHIAPKTAVSQSRAEFPFDLCIWAGPFTVPTLARESQLPVNSLGQVRVDDSLRVLNHPNIYAVGDAAATGLRMSCQTAVPQGAYAASHLLATVAGKSVPPFRFSFISRCVSLGRQKGIIQFTQQNDAPTDSIVTGWWAARIKELICQSATFSLNLERRLPNSYHWPQKLPVNPTPEAIEAILLGTK